MCGGCRYEGCSDDVQSCDCKPGECHLHKIHTIVCSCGAKLSHVDHDAWLVKQESIRKFERERDEFARIERAKETIRLERAEYERLKRKFKQG